MGKGSGGQRGLNSENDDKHLFSGGERLWATAGVMADGCRETALVLSRESNEYEGSYPVKTREIHNFRPLSVIENQLVDGTKSMFLFIRGGFGSPSPFLFNFS